MWHWYLPLCLCLTFVTAPPPSHSFPPLFSIDKLDGMVDNTSMLNPCMLFLLFVVCLFAYFFNNYNSEETKASKTCVWCLCFLFILCMVAFVDSSLYSCNCWLGVKHQVTYLLLLLICLERAQAGTGEKSATRTVARNPKSGRVLQMAFVYGWVISLAVFVLILV